MARDSTVDAGGGPVPHLARPGFELGGDAASSPEPIGHVDHRPWGSYTILADEDGHKVKRIDVLPGKRLSLQRHRRRAEHWFVVQGELVATVDGLETRMRTGDSLDVPRGATHRMENRSKEAGTFIEVQTGDYFGEDDIERLQDDYGRV
jgi:mannose-6-phosphate isomerase